MELIQQAADPGAYLAADEAIDHEHPLVRQTAARLRRDAPGLTDYARAAYEFVRDTIPHSSDTGDLRITWRASDVLRERTGICCAKSHALAALLRAESIPTGLCYQRLDGGVHGLIAINLPSSGRWARQDPRGNKPGIDAQFSLDEERLAWPVRPELGECDYPTVYAAPPPAVLEPLRQAADRPHLWRLWAASL